MFSQRSLKLSSFHFFFLYSSCSMAVIFTFMSPGSLILSSASFYFSSQCIFHFGYCSSLIFFKFSSSLLNIYFIFSVCAFILFLRSSIIFTIITLNSFSGRLSVFPSLSCSSAFYLCSFIWNIFFCCLNLSFRVCSPTGCRIIVPLAFGVCPLVDRASLRGLCSLPGVKDWCLLTGGQSWILSLWWARLCQGVYLRDGCGLRKTLSCCLLMGWGCVPVLLVVRPGAAQHWRSTALAPSAVEWGHILMSKLWPPGQLYAKEYPVPPPQVYLSSQ